jgi:hypothetical protein
VCSNEYSAGQAQNESYCPQNQRVTHGIARRTLCRNIAADHRVHHAIRQCQKVQSRIKHRLSPRWVNLEQMQHLVSPERKNNHRKKSQNYRTRAARDCGALCPALLPASSFRSSLPRPLQLGPPAIARIHIFLHRRLTRFLVLLNMFNLNRDTSYGTKDLYLFTALISVTLWILTAYIAEHWLSQHAFVRILYLSLPPAAVLVVMLLPSLTVPPVLKELAKEWWKILWIYAAIVSVSAVLILLISSAVGYLPYSDRPGPGWSHISPHVPAFEEIRYFSGWAVLLLPMCFFNGSLLFVFMAWLKWLSAPAWLARILGGLFSAAFGILAVAAAGWYIAISASVSNVVGIVCLLFGLCVLPRIVMPRAAALSLSARVLGIAVVFVFMTTLLVYPFL